MSLIEDIIEGTSFWWIVILSITMIYTIVVIATYYKLDQHEPEPIENILICFLGGIISPIFSSPLVIFMEIISRSYFSVLTQFVSIVIYAPIFEEIAKGMVLIFITKYIHLDGPLDGMMYGMAVGAGFAFVENFIFGITSLFTLGVGGGIGITVLRGGFTLIGHPLYTALFGFIVGCKSVQIHRFGYQQIWQSILLHMGWNFSLVFPFSNLTFLILSLFTVAIISIIVVYRKLELSFKIDQQLYQKGYYEEKSKYKTTFRN